MESKKKKIGTCTCDKSAIQVEQGITSSTLSCDTYVTPPQIPITCIADKPPNTKPVLDPYQLTSPFITGESLLRPLPPVQIRTLAADIISSPTETSLLLPNISPG